MSLANTRFGVGPLLREIGLLLIVLTFVFQIIAPVATVAASTTDVHDHHQEMSDAASKCPMQADGAADIDGTHENIADCVPSMCCFHDIATSFAFAATGALLPGSQIMERGKAPSSNAGPAQDRPPRHV